MKLSRQSFFPQVTLGVLAILVTFGCSKVADQANSRANFSLPLDGSLSAQAVCDDFTLVAQLVVDADPPINLTVNCGTSTVSGTVTGLSGGLHTFTINYYVTAFPVMILATQTTTATVTVGQTTTVDFSSVMITSDDGDGDGASNLEEVNGGSLPNNPTSIPPPHEYIGRGLWTPM